MSDTEVTQNPEPNFQSPTQKLQNGIQSNKIQPEAKKQEAAEISLVLDNEIQELEEMLEDKMYEGMGTERG